MRTLLLADDSITIQRVIALTFANEEFHVVTVSDGQQAIDKMASQRPDIVLAGTTMPNVDGYDLARYVRSQPAWTDVPVLLLTGAFETVDPARLEASGASGILEKPFEPMTVINRVKELLGIKTDAPAPPAAGRLVTSAGGPVRKAAPKPAGAPVPSVAPASSRLRTPGPAKPAPASWDELREVSGLAPDARSVEAAGAAGANTYLDTLDAAFDSLDQHLAGNQQEGRNPEPPVRQAAPADPGPPPLDAGTPPGAATQANPVFEVESDWFAASEGADAGRQAEQKQLAAELGIHEVEVPPPSGAQAPVADLDFDFGLDAGTPRAPEVHRQAAVDELTEAIPDDWAPRSPEADRAQMVIELPEPEPETAVVAPAASASAREPSGELRRDPAAAAQGRVGGPAAPAAPAAPAVGVADTFSALLAFEQGERSELPTMAPPPPPEITGEMLDQIAARVVEGIQVPAPPAPEITGAMLDHIAARVAEGMQVPAPEINGAMLNQIAARVAERLQVPAPEITEAMLDRIAERVANRLQVPAPEITDAMLDQIAHLVAERLGPGLFGEYMKDALAGAVRDTVREVVSDSSERLVRDEIDRIRQQAERE
jgi:CheY-like chemotaxis protein